MCGLAFACQSIDKQSQRIQDQEHSEKQADEVVVDSLPDVQFITAVGQKADYSIEIPKYYTRKQNIGANVDLKFADSLGASIITVVKSIPGATENDIHQMRLTDDQIVAHYESEGAQNVKVIKTGFKPINGTDTYYMIYTDDKMYHQSINLIKDGKLITLTYSCDVDRKDSYSPYIYRVINSLRLT